MDERLRLSSQESKKLVGAIKEYYLNERNEEIGDLAAMLLLDFMVEKLGPLFYNRGIRDSIRYIYDKLEDLRGLEIWRTSK